MGEFAVQVDPATVPAAVELDERTVETHRRHGCLAVLHALEREADQRGAGVTPADRDLLGGASPPGPQE